MYLNRASMIEDRIERMRLLMSASVSYFYNEKIWEKPLNPLLGETYQARGQDGAFIFME